MSGNHHILQTMKYASIKWQSNVNQTPRKCQSNVNECLDWTSIAGVNRACAEALMLLPTHKKCSIMHHSNVDRRFQSCVCWVFDASNNAEEVFNLASIMHASKRIYDVLQSSFRRWVTRSEKSRMNSAWSFIVMPLIIKNEDRIVDHFNVWCFFPDIAPLIILECYCVLISRPLCAEVYVLVHKHPLCWRSSLWLCMTC